MAEIQSLLTERRLFPPTSAFASAARVGSVEAYERMAKRAKDDPEGFWAEIASELHWETPWRKVLDWDLPDAKWFDGGKTNMAYNCLDRHVSGPRADKVALLWEGEPGDSRSFTYRELHQEVCRAANMLASLGVKAGDRVAIYLPMIPEAAFAILACARIGAPHCVVFGGFSAEALHDRLVDSSAKVVITADGGWRRGKVVALKGQVDAAVAGTSVERVVVVKRCENQVAIHPERDAWWHELAEGVPASHDASFFDSEHPLYTLYTSGTTGKPKGILHTTGGYMVGCYYSTGLVFDLRPDDIYWCTADVGWVTGHSYVIYGPLLCGATTVMYEGAPDSPDLDRFWRVIEKYRVTILYTAPTAIRTFHRWGNEYPNRCDLSSLRLLGSVGEPINPEAWMWYHQVIGKERCPIVDTWWQTETGIIMISPLPGAIATKPGSCTRPLPGIDADVVDKSGKSCGPNEGGYLVIRRPWPAMLRTIWGDHERFRAAYFGEIEGVYFAGDGARRDEDGYFWIMGRVDDVINVSGHRLSTMEVESALVSHDLVSEAAVVAKPDEIKGQAIVAFVTPKSGVVPSDDLARELRAHVVAHIGALARPQEIRFADGLPKTRSGKIMRRLLRDVASGSDHRGDTTTLEDGSVLARLAAERGNEE